MTRNTSFQDRVSKLRQDAPVPPPPPRVAPVSRGPSFAVIGLVVVIAIGVLGMGYFYLEHQKRPHPMTALASSYLKDETPPEFGAGKGLFKQSDSVNNYQLSCLRFMPAAPEGWVRINTWDARYPAVMPKLQTLWQQHGKPLEASRGYNRLASFIRVFAQPATMKDNRRGGIGLSTAYYFNIERDTFAQITFRHKSWRESKYCSEEFVTQWTKREDPKHPRHQLFDRFNIKKNQWNRDRLSAAARQDGQARQLAIVPVSHGLTIEVEGLLGPAELRMLFNDLNTADLIDTARAVNDSALAIW